MAGFRGLSRHPQSRFRERLPLTLDRVFCMVISRYPYNRRGKIMSNKGKVPAIAYLRTSSAANVGADKDSDRRQRVGGGAQMRTRHSADNSFS